jgi:sucrose synthase
MNAKHPLTGIMTKNDRKEFREYIAYLAGLEQKFFLRNEIIMAFRQYCDINAKNKRFRENSSIFDFIKKIQELFVNTDHIALLHRHDIAKYAFYILRCDGEYMEEIDSVTYLDMKDRHALPEKGATTSLHIDFMPFYDYAPSMKDAQNIGNGIRFLNRYLCSQIFVDPDKWHAKLFNFIKLHKYNEQQLLVNGALIKDFRTFFAVLQQLLRWLKTRKPEDTFASVALKMRREGFEAGWGNSVGRIIDSMQLLIDLIHEPDAELLGRFISRVPMPLISKVAIISPHGWFGQSNVLGKPDTGGQVIYILDQVRALEKHLKAHIAVSGLDIAPKIIVLTRLIPEAGDTTCDQKLEKIFQTDNGWILRVPFKDANGNVLQRWISRFKIWPYLETFAEDAATELLSQFSGRPDLIIGNYSDGNLVATLLSDKLDVVQCAIAHALEKTKYLFSDLYWQHHEDNYHFSLQFTADILAMNKSDFIITSTLQEIFGTEDTMGQYESYQFFTMPTLYRVINGINLYAPKFNVIRPGVDEDLYFPYYLEDREVTTKSRHWEQRLFHDRAEDIFGELQDPEKPPIFTMARFDKIKNITGLIEAFGGSRKLQENFNLIFAAGTIHLEASHDFEEQQEIRKAYELITRHNLHGKIRWLPSINKLDTGVAYRAIARRKGIFVQPALFEAFGLTIIEAMVSGLPTFGPKFGGPLEIIEYGISGFLLNTSQPRLIARSIEDFADRWKKDASYWSQISENGIRRVQEHFTWKLYSDTIVFLAKLYGFWRYSVSGEGRVKLDRYCDLIYHFLFKERARHLDA